MSKFTINKPLSPLYPSEWKDAMDLPNTYISEYPNLQFFKHHCKTVTQKDDDKCGITYADALDELVRSVPRITQGDYDVIKNRVKNNLQKKGLISESVYESYHYTTEGGTIDVAKLVEGNPECCLVPNESYVNYFYELYINVSYPGSVEDHTIVDNMAKILATVELLEQEHIFCKITLVDTALNVSSGDLPHNLTIIPLFSHKDTKTIEGMSSVLNERLLRKFLFATYEDLYGSDLNESYGQALELPHCITPVGLDECELASSIIDKVITPGVR